jgi:hypothetical protein
MIMHYIEIPRVSSSAAMRYAGTLGACGLRRGAREAGPRRGVGRPPRTIVVLALQMWVLITESGNSVRVARTISADLGGSEI